MAVDNDIPVGSPGLANFESETWGNAAEWLYSDTPALVEKTVSITASGADLTITFLDVIATDGEAAVQTEVAAADRANYIAAATITILDGETKDVPVYAMGHFAMDALTWDATYDTDAKKKAAFEGSVSPSVFVSKAKHSSGAIYD